MNAPAQFRTAEQNRAALIMHRLHGYIVGAILAFALGCALGVWAFWPAWQTIGAGYYLLALALDKLNLLAFLAARVMFFYRLNFWYAQNTSALHALLNAMLYPAIMGILFSIAATIIRHSIIKRLASLNKGSVSKTDGITKLR